MNLKKYFTIKTVRPELKATSKESVIEEMVGILCFAGMLEDKCARGAIEALLDRERKMSTGIQYGVAIPHAKTSAVTELVAVLGIKRGGIDFGALDGKPSNIFILTLSPEDRPVPHVQFLAEIMQKLQSEELRKRLLASETEEDIIATFFESNGRR